MKRKGIVICSVFIVMAVLVTGIIRKSMVLGNMKRSSSEPVTGCSSFSFPAGAGERIKISFSSKVKEGTLDIKLYDSERNIVKELDYAKKLQTVIVLDREDTYTLEAEYTEFAGKYSMEITKK